MSKQNEDAPLILPSREQFGAYVEAEIAKDEAIQKPTILQEPPQAHRDIMILATAFQHGAELWKDLEKDAESPAIRWLAKGHKEELEFIAARIRELLDPTVKLKPELAASAIEAAYQAIIPVMQTLDAERKNGNLKNGDD